jgi:hypothetical protein
VPTPLLLLLLLLLPLLLLLKTYLSKDYPQPVSKRLEIK